MFILKNIIYFISLFVPLLVAIIYFTVLDRKVMASMQRRKGPDVVGFWGLLQGVVDGVKLLLKDIILPTTSNKFLFIFAPIYTFAISLIGWAVIPYDFSVVVADLNLGILFIYAMSALGVYGVIIAGWASNSKYAFLGSMRSAAQMISYDVSLGFIILIVVLFTGSANLTDIVEAQTEVWFISILFPVFLVAVVSILAETNRVPFDLVEAEAELVAGYNVEYSGMLFALFFLAEYSSMLLMSAFITILFLGGWLPIFFSFYFTPSLIWFTLKLCFCVFMFVWIRATLLRYRYDQLMKLGWKFFLPLILILFIMYAITLYWFDLLP